MTNKLFCTAAVCAAALVATGLPHGPTHAQTRQEQTILAPRSLPELRAQDTRVQQMMRGGELRIRESRTDRMMTGRTIERADQYHQGIRVFGGGVTRQVASGQTVSVFGTLYDGIQIDTGPAVAEIDARRTIATRTGQPLGAPGELVVLPLENGGYAVTWKIRAFTGDDLREYFVDAKTGAVVFDYSDLQTQSVGRGTGVNGDSKKISVRSGSGGFFTEDGLRPAPLRTYDLKGDTTRVENILNAFTTFQQADFAADADNVWTDGAVVDAHVFSGLTYDYYFKRFNRHGINDANLIMRTMVHPAKRENVATQPSIFFTNAFYAGGGYLVYGVGLAPNQTANGRSWNFMSGALDIVAHEITHGVTEYTSDLIYLNESGALNESFSDIMATGAEFFFQAKADEPLSGNQLLRADYVCGEDVVRAGSNPTHGIRSMANPSAYGHPDHYSIRFTGTTDNGGVHINSSISNHAFYLAIEGGVHRLSGVLVEGVGSANREQIERVFYRAFTQFLTPTATFAVARAATIQAARDLYGVGSAAERAVTQAWTAVGVN
jgi:bacillolysin